MTTILANVIAVGGVAIIALGLWGLYVLMVGVGIHTDDPNNSCRFCPNWPCAGLAAVARAGGPSTKPLKEVFASQSCDESGPPLQSAEGRCELEIQ